MAAGRAPNVRLEPSEWPRQFARPCREGDGQDADEVRRPTGRRTLLLVAVKAGPHWGGYGS
ncbi:hypothetical protein GCM10020367_23550 [Streptomyces sannanensis]|uniref:Uncharacterized protein n=1 Tax=Streptomyces sannanensis TaxID=285536 RepID=A0ABP6SAB3_9ACTN